jgi:hypothetical protein
VISEFKTFVLGANPLFENRRADMRMLSARPWEICPSCLVDNRKTVPLYCNINVQAKLFTITSTERDDDYSILVEWTLLPGRTVLSVT